ncbi:gliding motility-associated C-terminal domain-containing protein [Larkinella soli]|uniref:gliding motility-associated C-terminal domain-containing protein n=1 Tax=Larkinella soli TaxID=1770527 RepID=UPI000FFBFF96|nr:gliding motility-associated C-terminal domain-containing protein [Larkinella soli]
MAQRITVIAFLALLFVAGRAEASHIVGGNARLTARGAANQYSLGLHLFIDELNSQAGDLKPTVKLAIYRRRDDLKMGEYELALTSQQPLAASSQVCASLRPLKLREVLYTKDIELDPNRFDDPGGYYVVHGVCCRSDLIDNIVQADQSGMVFHLEFPAVKGLTNSSPEFVTPTGEYACMGQPFTFSFKAADADGDQLKYSIVTPYKGFTSQGIAYDNQPSPSYPTVSWKAGFSPVNAVPGNPALRIDAETGQISVTATQVGLFAFAVLCEEFRNGRRIGSVRRDFQLAVVDCPTNAPPTPTIALERAPETAKIRRENNGVLSGLSICKGQSVTLKTETSAQWIVQWQRDGQDLPGDTTASLVVKEAGSYTVVKRFRSTCGKPSPSQVSVKVDMSESDQLKLTASGPTAFCEGKSVLLKAPEKDYSYVWSKDDRVVQGALGASHQAYETGEYKVEITSAETGCTVTDSILVNVFPKPATPAVTASATIACSGDTIRLSTADRPLYRYQWTMTGIALAQPTGPTLAATQAGHYVVTVTDTNQCQAVSGEMRLQFKVAPVVTMETPAPVCENGAAVTLRAQPEGGTFAGLGKAAGAVKGSEFIPGKVGPGQYVITYSLNEPDNTCPGRTQQTVVVLPAPVVHLKNVTARRGTGVVLNEYSSDTLSYTWTPSVGLSSPVAARPVAMPDTTTTYYLTALSSQGCEFSGKLTVTVMTALFIPDAFSPNNDGMNDQWQIRGIDDYPDCTVEIYNRWGNCIFVSRGYQQPWDGRYDGKDLPQDAYQYVIKTGGAMPTQRGTVLLAR